MGVKEWHAGYCTLSRKKYRHVINKGYLGKMRTSERIRFAMWTSNDFLPGLQKVGWKTANEFHRAYENLQGQDVKVT